MKLKTLIMSLAVLVAVMSMTGRDAFAFTLGQGRDLSTLEEQEDAGKKNNEPQVTTGTDEHGWTGTGPESFSAPVTPEGASNANPLTDNKGSVMLIKTSSVECKD